MVTPLQFEILLLSPKKILLSVHCIISLSILICTWGLLLITIYETSTKNGKFNKFVVLKPLRETHLPFIDLKSLKQTVYWLMKKEMSIK